MSETGWFFLIAFSGVALASMAVRAIPRHKGSDLPVYLVTLALAGLAGAGVAAMVDSSWIAVGAIAGIASVEVGPAAASAVRRLIAARTGGKR